MTDTPRCGARTRAGGPCQKPPEPGATRCRLHGGASPRAKAKAAERVAVAKAEVEVARLGARRDIHPADALVELVQFTAGEVAYWRQRVNDLDDADLVWGKTKEKTGGDDRGTTYEAKPNIAYAMLERSSDRLASYAAAALKAGVQERQIRLAEAQGQVVVQVLRAVLERMFAAVVDMLRAKGVDDQEIVAALQKAWADAMAVIVPQELRRLGEGNAA